ncbi:MAG: hypothetical protein U0234_09825 [Sandaracinus sp.]
MAVDLQRMLEMARRDQWQIDRDLDWSVKPRSLSRQDEISIVQYFTDMAGIEQLAGALFAVQRDNATDPTLRAIFQTFVIDEERHSRVAERLARHYDVHRYKTYERNPHLVAFAKHFVKAARELTPDIANSYITTGELLLDIALLRSIDDYVDDDMSHAAMKLINRDESRHIAVDYHMSEYYASAEYDAWLEKQPRRRKRDRARAAVALAGVLFHAQPFFRDVFFGPMELVDADGKRLREAFKRIQLLGLKTGNTRPFSKFLRSMFDLYNHPRYGRVTAPFVTRVMGVPERVLTHLYSEDEERNLANVTYAQMADDALSAKTLS